MTKMEIHKEICDSIHPLYERKNHDYGDSYGKLRAKYPESILIRLNDKLSRLEVLMSGEQAMVKEESIDDTLFDLANYAIMELTERKAERTGETEANNAELIGKYIMEHLGVENDGLTEIQIDSDALGIKAVVRPFRGDDKK